MGTGEEVRISMSGGGPWGFRLLGGSGAPLVVSKIRKKSKAHSAGVQEGDVVVSVNGKSVEGQSHLATMELVDSGNTLDLGVRRGAKPRPGETKQAPPESTPQVESQTGTYSETLLGREAKLVKEDRTVEEVRVEEPAETAIGRTIPVAAAPTVTVPVTKIPVQNVPVAIQPVATVPVTTIPAQRFQVSQAPVSVAPATARPVVTNGSSLIDDALSKLETFPKVTDAFATSSESFEHASLANEQVTSNLSTETVTAELKENFKENIAPRKFTDYNSAGVQPPVPTFHVKQVDVNRSVWQPTSSQFGGRPQQRGPSIIDYQKSKFQKQAPPTAPKPKAKPSRQQVGPTPFQPLRPTQQSRNFQPPRSNEQLLVSPKQHHKMPHVFGPPVTISIDPSADIDSDNDSGFMQKKKLFSDSAFYDDPNAVYPTIDEQMKLCKSIALSLTSDDNKRARGAKMFAKRQKRAPKWIHEGMEISSSGGDVCHLDDLDSELSCEEGGNKPLFTFKIPKLAQQKSDPGKMSLTQDEFEKLRLDKHRCEHKTVSPNTCFNLVSDLTSAKGRGAKIFEKRRAKAEEWVVDDSNVPKAAKPSPLSPGGGMLNRPTKSPWEAALDNPYGNVDAAFGHLNDRNNTFPEPALVPMHSQLPAGEQSKLLDGPKFNRTAKGWTAPKDAVPTEDIGIDFSRRHKDPPTSQQQPVSRQQPPFRDYNPKPKAWKAPEAYQQPLSQQQQSYSYSTPTSSVSYGSQAGRWPSSQASNSYSYSHDSHVVGQPQYSYSQQQQQTLYGTDL